MGRLAPKTQAKIQELRSKFTPAEYARLQADVRALSKMPGGDKRAGQVVRDVIESKGLNVSDLAVELVRLFLLES